MSVSTRRVSVRNSYPGLHIPRQSLPRLIHWLDAWDRATIPHGSLSLAFLDDACLAALHLRFLDDPSPTDVITFSGSQEDDLAGEICVSVERALYAAPAHNETFARELTRYLVHGWLHLAGEDDLTPAGRRRMRRLENQALDQLQTVELLPRFSLK